MAKSEQLDPSGSPDSETIPVLEKAQVEAKWLHKTYNKHVKLIKK